MNTATYDSKSVTVLLPTTKYADKILRSKSYEELRERFMEAESPVKEITESYAAFYHMKKFCQLSNFTWLHIGDGGYTRTAAIFAFFSKSLNISIDPALNFEKFNKWSLQYKVQNIVPYCKKFQDYTEKDILNEILFQSIDIDFPSAYNIVCVHAHVKLEEVNKQYPNWCFLYTNPCCSYSEQTFSEQYMKENNITKVLELEDLNILSDKRTVIIYKNNKK